MNVGTMRGQRGQAGQAIVVLALFIAVLLAITAVVLDGGNSVVEHRETQNAADAAALAGATVMVKNVGDPGSVSSGEVLNAIQASFAANGANLVEATYVRYDFSEIGPVSSGGQIPIDAGGVKTGGYRTFDTYLAFLAGMDTMRADAQAMALAGVLQGACVDCAFLPVTFPVQVVTCDGTNRSMTIGVDWVNVPLDTALSDSAGRWEAIVPLCTNGPGDVGWLDFGELADEQGVDCGNNLNDWIHPPCEIELPVPNWYHAHTGNTNATENAINQYIGQVVMLPLFDGTCRDDPSPGECTDPGVGDNFWYHVPKVAAFLLDEAYIQGNDHPQCNQDPGYPHVGGNGTTGCLKGWFIDLVSLGQVGDSSGSGGNPSVLGVQLVR